MKAYYFHALPGLLGLLLATPLTHAGEVNKCVDAAGNLTLTDEPCRTLKPKPVPGIKATPAPMPSAVPPAPLLPLPEKQYAAPPPPPPPMEPPRY